VIILDFNQVCISNLMAQLGNHTNTKIDESLLRHMILNTVRSLNVKFKEQYGELIIACDSKNNWRREVYPYYKASRRKAREESELDWKFLFETLAKIRAELKEFFPYPVIEVEGCEADDVIAALVFEYGDFTPILILSGDKDFLQLHTFSMTKQYDPVHKKWISSNDPLTYLMEHILRGDAGDGVPNVLSPDDTFVTGTRQKPLTQKKIDILVKDQSSVSRNFHRNAMLIDLSHTPTELNLKILSEYNNQQNKTKSKLFDYFIKYKLSNLMESIGDF
jgi:hypothetical protein